MKPMDESTLALESKNVVIVGLGRTAVALARLLRARGARPFITESRGEADLAALPDMLRAEGIEFECGGHTQRAFDDADIVVPSPGVPPTIPPFVQAAKNGAEVLGEMEIASHFINAPMIAITGTNGKTTTTALVHALIEQCGFRSVLVGNNDCPLSEAAMLDSPPDYAVVEVSSYQLETVQTFHPRMAAVLNLSNDHLARHGTMDNYAAVKARIFMNQTERDIAVFNMDDARRAGMRSNIHAHVVPFTQRSSIADGMGIEGEEIHWCGERVGALSDIPLPGRHNRENVLAALCLMRAGDFDWPKALIGLRSFAGVEHRIEYVATVNGVKFYNDSKSTNLDSLRVALESFDQPIILLAGGRGKGSDYAELNALVQANVQRLVVFGEDAETIEAAYGGITPTQRVQTLTEAAEAAARHAQSGDIVLLSPACASFDQFPNFEARGRAFKAWVTQQTEAVST